MALRLARRAQARRSGRSAGDLPGMPREVGLPLVAALVDQRDGRNRKAAWELFLLRDRAPRFGGSHAQRDLISQTLLAVPMWLLFEIGILFGHLVVRRRPDEYAENP